MKKRGLSIRYKVLLLVISLPLAVLVAYLFMARNIFVSDKIAYVFDSSSNLSGTLASQIKTQLNASLYSARTIFADYLNQRQFTDIGRQVFANDFLMENVLVVSANSAEPTILAHLEKSEGLTQRFVTRLGGGLTQMVQEMGTESRSVKVPFQDDLLLVMEKVKGENEEAIFILALRLSELSELFTGLSAQVSFLVSGKGEIYFGPQAWAGKNLKQFISPQFLNNSSALVGQGVETLRDQKGIEQLVAFSRVGFADLFVVTAVERQAALGAVKILTQRSLIFFGLLVSISVLIGLVASSGLTSALTSLFRATQKVAEGNFDINVQVTSRDEVGALAENFNVMAEEVKRLLEQTAEKARMESELNTARTVQETLFPEARGAMGPLAISGFYEPASECGGDWWHYCAIGSKIFLWIGDATGHGVPAALITAAAKSASTIIENLNVGPAEAMTLLNRAIYDVSKGKIMMTFFLAAYDITQGTLTYANASHEAPFLIKKSDEPLKKKALIPLNDVTNPRLGQNRETVYQEVSVPFDFGDYLFFYTDGIPDIQNPQGESMGEREFLKCLISSFKNYPDVQDGVRSFVETFSDYRQNAPLVDDVTFFVVKNEGIQ